MKVYVSVSVHGGFIVWEGWNTPQLSLSHPLVYAWMCVYGRGGVCVHGEREDTCIWKGWGIRAQRENVYTGGVDFMYMEGLETHHPSPHARTLHPFSLYTSTLSPCTHSIPSVYTHPLHACTLHPFRITSSLSPCMVHCRQKGWSVHARGDDVCIWKGWSVCAWGEGRCVYMEGVECECTERG